MGIGGERGCGKRCPGGETPGVCHKPGVDTVLPVQLGNAVRGGEIIRVGDAIYLFKYVFWKTIIGTQVNDPYPPREQFSCNRHRRCMRNRQEGNVRINGIGRRVLEPEIGKSLEMGMYLRERCSCKAA